MSRGQVDPNAEFHPQTFVLANVPTRVQRDMLGLVRDERNRQDAKWGQQRHLPSDRWNTIVVEEVGEAAKAINERDWANLPIELMQVAAVYVAWAEDIALSLAEGIEPTR